MKRLAWLLRRHATTLALWGGVALALAALAAQWFVIRPLEARIETLERARATGRDNRLMQAEGELSRDGGPRAQLTAFYGWFDRGDRLTDLLAKLHVVGKTAGLEIKRAEYRMNHSPERRLDRYQVVMPIRGSYQAVRLFIASALRELPMMSLDQVQFQRKEVGDATVDAQVSFTFHLAR